MSFYLSLEELKKIKFSSGTANKYKKFRYTLVFVGYFLGDGGGV